MRTLVIGNKCYSSWSMRAWLLMRQLGIPFDEVLIPLDQPDTARRVAAYSPAGRVPVLVDDDVTVWDSIAIMEHLAETTDAPVWPTDRAARAMARSITAEMHAGFPDLRRAYPVNLGKRYAYRERPEAEGDLRRILEIFTTARERFGADGPFLFGEFSAADAMFAPVVTRLDTYSVPVEGVARTYMDEILALPAFRAWRDAALEEPWVIADDEVDEPPVAVLRKVPGRPAV